MMHGNICIICIRISGRRIVIVIISATISGHRTQQWNGIGATGCLIHFVAYTKITVELAELFATLQIAFVALWLWQYWTEILKAQQNVPILRKRKIKQNEMKIIVRSTKATTSRHSLEYCSK